MTHILLEIVLQNFIIRMKFRNINQFHYGQMEETTLDHKNSCTFLHLLSKSNNATLRPNFFGEYHGKNIADGHFGIFSQ